MHPYKIVIDFIFLTNSNDELLLDRPLILLHYCTYDILGFMNQHQPYKKLVTKLTALSKKSNWIMMRVLDLQMNYPETSYENIHQLQKLLVHTSGTRYGK